MHIFQNLHNILGVNINGSCFPRVIAVVFSCDEMYSVSDVEFYSASHVLGHHLL